MKTALVTGASSGIGKEFAELLAKDKYNLVITARSEDKLNEIAEQLKSSHGIEVTVIPFDLSKPSGGLLLHQELQNRNITINVLINNAGYGDFGDFVTTDEKKTVDMMNLNMVNLTELTLVYSKEMVAKNDGMILNIASTAAFQPMPKFATYAATKAYVLHLTEAIHFELRKTNVHVCTLCPGPTKTGFEAAANLDNSPLFDKTAMSATKVAQIGYQGLKQNKVIIIPGVKNKILAFIANGTPFRKLTVWITSKMV
jgi:short-subunit dehydrogenase